MKMLKTWGVIALSRSALAWSALSGACQATTEEPKPCFTVLCQNAARVAGQIAVQEDAQLMDVRFCHGQCVGGLLDVPVDGGAAVCTQSMEPYIGVCLSREGPGSIGVEASWGDASLTDVPADGGVYQLQVTDHRTGELLIDVTREADYEVWLHDDCQVCWAAEMKL